MSRYVLFDATIRITGIVREPTRDYIDTVQAVVHNIRGLTEEHNTDNKEPTAATKNVVHFDTNDLQKITLEAQHD